MYIIAQPENNLRVPTAINKLKETFPVWLPFFFFLK